MKQKLKLILNEFRKSLVIYAGGNKMANKLPEGYIDN